jgi:hypothetical protein
LMISSWWALLLCAPVVVGKRKNPT